MNSKKRDPGRSKHHLVRLTKKSKSHQKNTKFETKTIKTKFATKPLFDPIAGP